MFTKSQSSIFTWVSGVLGGLMLVVLSQGASVAQNSVVETNTPSLNFIQAVFFGVCARGNGIFAHQ